MLKPSLRNTLQSPVFEWLRAPQVFPPTLPLPLGASCPSPPSLTGVESGCRGGGRHWPQRGKPPPSPQADAHSCPQDPEPGEDSQSQTPLFSGLGLPWSTGADCHRVPGAIPGEPCGLWESHAVLSPAQKEDSSVRAWTPCPRAPPRTGPWPWWLTVNCKGCGSPGDKDCGDPVPCSRGQCVHTCASVSTHTYKHTLTLSSVPCSSSGAPGERCISPSPPPRLQRPLSGVDASVAGCPSLCTCRSRTGSVPWPVLCSLPQPVPVNVTAPLL